MALLVAVSNLVCAVASGWLSQAILRYQSVALVDPYRYFQILKLAVSASMFMGLVAIVAIISLYQAGDRSAVTFFAASVLVIGLIAHTVSVSSLQAEFRPTLVALLETLRAMFALPLAIGLLVYVAADFRLALLAIGISYAGSGAFAWVGVTRAARLRVPRAINSPSTDRMTSLRGMYSFGWPLSVWLGVALAFPVADRFLIQQLVGVEASGIYAAVYDIVYRGCGFALIPIVLASHPRIMRAYSENQNAYALKIIRNALLVQAVICIIVSLIFWLLGPAIAALIFPQLPGDSVVLFVPLAVAGCLWQIGLMTHKVIEMSEKTSVLLFLLGASLAIAILMNIWALPRYGVVGAAYSLLLASIVYCVGTGAASALLWRSLKGRGGAY